MESFALAIIAVQCILILLMFCTSAHLLARVRRLEHAIMTQQQQQQHARRSAVDAVVPRPVLRDLNLHVTETALLHVVDPDCSSCVDYLERAIASGPNDTAHRIVVRDVLAAAEISAPEFMPVVVAPDLVELVRSFGPMPHELVIESGTVSEHRTGTDLSVPPQPRAQEGNRR